MWLYGHFLVVVYCQCFIDGFFHRTQVVASEPSASECERDCSEHTPRSICGTDGRTYDSMCDIDMAKCQGHPVEFKNFGKCAEKVARCEAQRNLLLKQGNQMLVPECNDDGSYSEVQCHKSTGYCWCVDKDGKPVRGSSVENKRPNCSPTDRRQNRRRSSRGRKPKKGCNNSDRTSFNTNLIDIFESEYNRLDKPPLTTSAGVEADPLTDTHQKAVVQWKFNQLDENGDGYLKKPEVKDLRRMAKKIVKPKVCAKTFAKYCDLDNDKKISRSEWSLCVGVDITNGKASTMDEVLDDAPAVNDHRAANPSARSLSIRPEPWDSQRQRLRHDGSLNSENNPSLLDSDEKEDVQDCETSRRAALDNHRQDPTAGIYIPECNKEGFYVKAQCHKSQRFCWCVHVRTGKPIRGTFAQGVKPDCESSKRDTRHFKGCSPQKKQEFQDELVETFVKEVLEDAKNKSMSLEAPTHEKAARWKFAYIDSNKNQVLDKKEWKIFKREWQLFHRDSKQKRRLRKCWRNLPRFCDENNNQKITIDEWLTCTGITRDFKAGPLLPFRRRGPNPFNTILKSD